MGVDTHVLRLLCESRDNGVSFLSTIMIGRQNYCDLRPRELSRALGITRVESSALLNQKYIEPLLKKHFGSGRIESLDYSAYEQATIIHDLNKPVPERLKMCFSCVFDGGAIEHVFNFPQAIKNCMEMVAVGGHFLGVTTANNFMGHGFYQFSPELFYRVFSPLNGYAVENMFLCETDPGARWYRVDDPEILGHRLELVNHRATYIMVVARRISDAQIFKTTPQQSDYMPAWGLAKRPGDSLSHSSNLNFTNELRSVASRILPRSIKTRLKRLMWIESRGWVSGGRKS